MRLAPGFIPTSRHGVCSICGTEQKVRDGDGVLLTDIDIDFEGTFDICVSCVKEAAGLIGYVPSYEADSLAADLALSQEYAAEVYDEVCAKQRQIEDLARCLAATAAERDAALAGQPA